MGLFSFFSKDNGSKPVTINLPAAEQIEPATESVASVEPTSDENSASDKPMTISYATGWPIDIIYGYLHKNYEQKGYDDAMLNSNLAFRDMNMKIIRNKILMTFREINLNYDAMKQDLDTRIETCNAAGLLTSAADLNKQMAVINAHKDELAQLEQDFRNNANEASVPLMSYECGFLRGISTIAMAGSTKTESIKAPVVPTLNTKSMAV